MAAEQIVGRTTGVVFQEPGRPAFQVDKEHRLQDMGRWAGFGGLVSVVFGV